MARNLTALNVALTAHLGPFQKAMGGAVGAVSKLGESIKNTLLSPLGLLTGVLSTGALIAGVKNAASRIDDLAKAADRLGVSTQSLTQLRYAAESSGASAELLTTSMEKLTNTVQEAAAGSITAQKALASIGMSARELVALAPDQQFAAAAEAIKNLGTQGQRTAATMDLFGKSGGQLLNTLTLGKDGLAEMAAEADKLGISITRVDAAKVEAANDAMTRIGLVFQGIFNRIVVQVAPAIEALANGFVGVAVEADGLGSAVDRSAQGAIRAVGQIGDAVQFLATLWHASQAGVAKLAEWALRAASAIVQVYGTIDVGIKRAVEVVWSAIQYAGAGIDLFFVKLKNIAAEVFQFVAGEFANLLIHIGLGLGRLNAEMGTAVQDAGNAVAASTGAMAAEAAKSLGAWEANLEQSSKRFQAATENMFAPMVFSQVAALDEIAEAYAEAAAQQAAATRGLMDSPSFSSTYEPMVANIQSEAQARAESRAAELAALQQHQLDTAKANADGMAVVSEHEKAEQDRKKREREQYWQHTLAGQSAFWGNLSRLQESNDKKVRKIGKLAAKAQIIVDTATAAMAGYKNGMIAGGPYAGPALGAAYAAAAIAAGAIQLANSQSEKGIGGSAPANTATTNLGGVQAPNENRVNSQVLVLEGDVFSAESIARLFDEAKERGYVIEGVRRG